MLIRLGSPPCSKMVARWLEAPERIGGGLFSWIGNRHCSIFWSADREHDYRGDGESCTAADGGERRGEAEH